MTKLEEAAKERYPHSDDHQAGFITGALWLLEQAQNQSFTIGANHPTENRWVSLTRLSEVCQSKEE